MGSVDENLPVKVESSTNESHPSDISHNRRYSGKYNNNKNFQKKRNYPSSGFKENEEGGNSYVHHDKFTEKIEQLSGPTFDLPPIDVEEKKFSGRNRLYIGNIGNEITEEDITNLFCPFGETREVFMNKDKNFAFIKLDFHSNAEKAKRELDGVVFKNRNLKIRFAPSGATIKIKNLSQHVSNELLHFGFRIFGEIERAIVCVDERGKSKGEGIVDFARKGSAMQAISKCKEGCFFLTGSLRPCIVENYDDLVDNDGLPEKSIPKRNNETYSIEREFGPSFATDGSFKYEYGQRWKQLFELFSEKEIVLKRQFEMEKEKLEAQMQYAKYEHETEVLREQLRFRELDRGRQKREWEMKEKHMEEQRRKIEENIRVQQEEIENTMRIQEEAIRVRQQENKIFMQKHKYMDREIVDNRSTPADYGSSKGILGEYDQNAYRGNEQQPHGYWVNDENTNMFMKRRRFM